MLVDFYSSGKMKKLFVNLLAVTVIGLCQPVGAGETDGRIPERTDQFKNIVNMISMAESQLPQDRNDTRIPLDVFLSVLKMVGADDPEARRAFSKFAVNFDDMKNGRVGR
jgi:hypothetical protein